MRQIDHMTSEQIDGLKLKGMLPDERAQILKRGIKWGRSQSEFNANVERYRQAVEQSDKGEQCVYCGLDANTCEHYEEPNRED